MSLLLLIVQIAIIAILLGVILKVTEKAIKIGAGIIIILIIIWILTLV